MNILIDTNRYTDFAQNDKAVIARFVEADVIYVPFITLAELRAGFRYGSLAQKNEASLSRFLQNAKVQVMVADENTTSIYADVYAQLRRQGSPIPTNDIWIAALAIQHSLPLYTRDKHFSAIPQLALV